MFCGKCGKDMGDAVSFCPHCGAPIKNNGKGEKNMKDKTYNIKDANGNKNGHHRSPVGKWIAVIIAVVVISAAAMLLNQRKPDHLQKGTETAESKESSETVQSTEAAETEQTKDVLMSYLQDTLIPAEGQINSVDEIRSYQLAGTSAADEDKTLVIPDGIAASFIKDMDGDGTEELHILRNEQKTENDDDYDFTYNCIFWEVYVCEDGKVSQVCSQEIIKYQATYAEEAYNVYLKEYNGKSYLYAEADGLSMDAKLVRQQNIFAFADNNIYTVRSLFTCGGNGGYTDIYKSDAVYLDDVNRVEKGVVVKKAEAEPYYVYDDGQDFNSFDSYLDGYTDALNKELSEYGITMSSDREKEYPFYGIYLADPATLDTHIFNYQLKPETFDYREMDADNYTVVIKGVHEGKKEADEVPAESETEETTADTTEGALTNEMLNGVWLQKDASDAMQLIFSSDENSVRYYTTISNGSEYTTNYSLKNDELKVDVVNLDGNDVTTLYFDLTYSEEENIKILTIQHSEKDDDIDTGALYGFDDLMDGTYVQVKESWVRKQLNVPEEADVSIFQREAYYWDAAQIYVRYFEIIEDDDTVATADVNALTGELAREISPYHKN